MRVKLIRDDFISGLWPNPVKGQQREVSREVGAHLLSAGVAIELKVEQRPEIHVGKKLERISASLADQASAPKTSKSRAKKSTRQ